ncbi:protein kinase domain-containing protein 47 [Elsinoe australis]|uniref:Protein kinase domain-containing protein 47 n=1 Tax=Elsinoe australis TaxID=40998 RepID=A0A4U7AMC9_9PEZI|nr:protein kinase domain-containing protein 47 [Elsinoe australis]
MAVNPSSKLYEVELGSAIGPDGRFKIIGFHHSSRTTASLLAQATYIAHDMRTQRYVTIIILSDEQTATYEEQPQKEIEQTLRKTQLAENHVLLPLDTFSLDTSGANLCFVYELFGPELQQVIQGEDSSLPGNWIQKVLKDALLALALMHSQELVHGAMRLWSLIMTYPNLDATNEEAVRKAYGLTDNDPSAVFNSTGSGGEEEEPNLDFQLKLQWFHQSFTVGDEVHDFGQYKMGGAADPPELMSQGPGQRTDIWYLAGMITNFISGTIADSFFLDDHQEILADSVSKLQEALYTEVHDMRQYMRPEEVIIEDTGSGDFSLDELRILTDLLAHMLDADPATRYTVEQALAHPFFAVQRPAISGN